MRKKKPCKPHVTIWCLHALTLHSSVAVTQLQLIAPHLTYPEGMVARVELIRPGTPQRVRWVQTSPRASYKPEQRRSIAKETKEQRWPTCDDATEESIRRNEMRGRVTNLFTVEEETTAVELTEYIGLPIY